MVGIGFENSKLLTACSLATASGLLVGVMWYRKYLKTRPPTEWMAVGEVDLIRIYPVKSFKGIQCPSFECSPLGARCDSIRDRSFVVVDHEGKFVTGRNYPKMTQLVPRISGTVVTVSSPGDPEEIQLDVEKIAGERKEVVIWGVQTQGLDCGDEVATWISRRVIGKDSGLRLLFCGAEGKGKAVSKTVRAYSKIADVRLQETDGGIFSDGVSYHLISQASISELNSRLDGAEVQALNFRPNIVIRGDMLIPFEEDRWKWVRVGDVVFQCLSPCTRCLFTTVDPNTGEKSEKMEPLASLKRYRFVRSETERKVLTTPAMGIYLGLRSEGRIAVGDTVFIPKV